MNAVHLCGIMAKLPQAPARWPDAKFYCALVHRHKPAGTYRTSREFFGWGTIPGTDREILA